MAVRDVMEMAHDKNHHFEIDRMFQEFEGLAFSSKTKKIRNYLQHCKNCQLLATRRTTRTANNKKLLNDSTC